MMDGRRIGVSTDDLGVPVKEGLRQAVRLGFGSVELGASPDSELSPADLSWSGRRHLARLIRGGGLTPASLTAEPFHSRPMTVADMDQRLKHARRVLELAADLGAPSASLYLGPLTDPETGEPVEPRIEALRYLTEQADRLNTPLAVRARHDRPEALDNLWRQLDCPWLRLCLDPADLSGDGRTWIAEVSPLAAHLGLSYLRDTRRSGPSGRAVETNLGEGDVDLPAYVAILETAHYAGPYIVRRTDSPQPVADLERSREYLRRLEGPGLRGGWHGPRSRGHAEGK